MDVHGQPAAVQSLLVSQLSALAKTYESTIERFRAEFKPEDIYELQSIKHDQNHIGDRFGALLLGYVQCMKPLGVQTEAELEQLWSKHYGEPEVKEAVDNLLEAEKKFTELLAEIESLQSPLEDKLTKKAAKVGQMLPKDLPVIEMPSGQPTALEDSWNGAKFTLFVLLRLLE